MAAALTPRQEAFARHLSEGKSQRAAYTAAGYWGVGSTLDENASRLARNDKVRQRVAEFQAGHAQRAATTVETIVAELEDARIGATAAEQFSAAVAASTAKARLLGLIVDRHEVGGVLRKPLREPAEAGAPKQMSIEEWREKFAPKRLDPDVL